MSAGLTRERICIWAGVVGFFVSVIGIVPLAQFLPPPSPALDAEAIAAIYQSNTLGIRLGCGILMFAPAFYLMFFSAISLQMRRMEGPDNQALSLVQIVGATLAVAAFFFGAMLFTIAAFRPERSPEITQMLNDFGWIMFVTPVAPAMPQTLGIGFAILGDKSPTPIMPRWMGYATIWLAIIFMPGALAMMFKTGPFAWDGILAFWIPFSVFGLWIFVMVYLMLKSLKGQAAAKAGVGA